VAHRPEGRLLLAQQQVDDPAAPDVRPRAAAVAQDVGLVATGFFQRIGKYS
jgi:hypothetical protein